VESDRRRPPVWDRKLDDDAWKRRSELSGWRRWAGAAAATTAAEREERSRALMTAAGCHPQTERWGTCMAEGCEEEEDRAEVVEVEVDMAEADTVGGYGG
jgi:hypothetical protein